MRRIADLKSLGAYVFVDEDAALASARAAEAEISAGRYRGPLHGIPIAYKDIFDVQGLHTTACSKILAHNVAQRDSTVASELRLRGAICLGKLNTPEFACGSKEFNGEDRNPWHPAYSAAGSSSGSAVALAAGLTVLATGSDTGGSIRLPASFTGIVGLKPTYGRVSRAGVIPLSWTLDHVGPMARTVSDAALLLGAMAGRDTLDHTSESRDVPNYASGHAHEGRRALEGIRVGIPSAFYFQGLNPEIESAVRAGVEVLERLGATVHQIDLPHARDGANAQRAICYAEALTYHWRNLWDRPQDYTRTFFHRIASAAFLTAEELMVAHRVRQVISLDLLHVFRNVDVIVTPTNSHPPFLIGAQYPDDIARLTRFVNLAGVPALSLPCGFTSSGLPIGMQLIASAWNEQALFSVGRAFEFATDWHRRRPSQSLMSGQSPTPPPTQSALHSPGGVFDERSAAIDAEWILQTADALNLTFVDPKDAGPIAADVGLMKAGLARSRAELDYRLEPGVRPVLSSD